MAKILIVDDEPDARLLVRMVLSRHGHELADAVDGLDAIEKIEQDVPDLILLDVRMPRIDGWEVVNELRERGLLGRCKVIMMSAHTGASVSAQVVSSGAHGFIEKPFGWEELLTTVEEVLPVQSL